MLNFSVLTNYLRAQVREISSDRVLRYYGFFVSTLVTLTATQWLNVHTQYWLLKDMDAICWPMFQTCRNVRVLSMSGLTIFFYVILVASIASGLLFLRERTATFAWFGLLIINIVKYGVILVDYRLRLNQHIIAFWITLAFLLIPRKKWTAKLLIILIYFWAGLIKIDPEWLSGSALYIKPWFISNTLLPWACLYVVFLEVILTWALLWGKRWMAWLTFAQLIIFHVFSFKIVGFFYPTLMFAILSIFPLCWILEPKKPSLMRELSQKPHLVAPTAVIAVIFSFFQILPKTFPGQTAVTGEGRLLALHMFDAFTSCQSFAKLRFEHGRVLRQNLYTPLAPRIRCDPIVYLSRARDICHRNIENKHLEQVDLFLETKRAVDEGYNPVIDLEDFCSKKIRYSFFSSNDWILK